VTTTLATATPSTPPPAPATPGSGPTATPLATATPAPPAKPRKIRTWVKSHVPQPIFAIVLLVLVILTIAILGAGGLATNKFVFVNTVMQYTLVLFDVAIMAYPLFLLAKQAIEKRDHWQVNFITRGVVILLSFLFTLLWLTALVRLEGGAGSDTPVRETYAGSLWSVPILGSIVFPVAAVALQALAAYLLVRYTSENPELAADKLALPSLNENLAKADANVTFAEAKVAPRDTRVKDLTKEIDDLTPQKDKAVKNLEKAKGKFDTSKVVLRRKAVATELDENKAKRATTLSDFEQKTTLARSAKGPAKAEYHNEAARLGGELTQLQTEQTDLETELSQLDTQVKDVRKQLRLKSLEKAADKLGAELKKKDEKLKKATKRLEKATTAFADASATRDKIKTERDDTQARIDGAAKALKNVWRDVALWAGLAAFCLFLAFVVFDASWYGWKLIAF